MAENSKIEWTDHTFNPWKWGPQGTRVRTSPANWRKPLAWNKQAAKEGRRFRVFCASLADVFEIKPDQPEMDEWRVDLFGLIDKTPNLDWLLLTKRPENIAKVYHGWHITGIYEPANWEDWPRNIWIGTSVENQEQADKRIPELLKVPAAVRFLSMEPLLGPVDLSQLFGKTMRNGLMHRPSSSEWPVIRSEAGNVIGKSWHNGIDWVIVGGESGSNARPMHPDWARDIRDQCLEAGVPFFFKQWGEYYPNGQMTGVDWRLEKPDASISVTTIPHDNGRVDFWRVGKKSAGRLLDGVEWNQFPQVEELAQ